MSFWSKLKAFFDQFSGIISTIMSAIGLFFTLYFSIWFVPDYVKEIETSRQLSMHASLVSDIQEFVFNESDISIKDVETLIHGHELSLGIEYNFTPEELLVQIQQDFAGNKFIPLAKRETLIDQLATIISQIKRPEKAPDKMSFWSSFEYVDIATTISTLVGFLVSAFALYGYARQIQRDKEVAEDLASEKEFIEHIVLERSHSALQFEQKVNNLFKELGFVVRRPTSQTDFGFDMEIVKKDHKFAVEVKYYRKLLGVGTANQIISQLSASGLSGVLVINTGLTQRALEAIAKFNGMNPHRPIDVIRGEESDDLKKQIEKLVEE